MNDSQDQIRVAWLKQLGVLPSDKTVTIGTPFSAETLLNLWNTKKAVDQVVRFITATSDTLKFEWLTENNSTRLLIWPFGKPTREQRLVGIVSSRLGRKLDEKTFWFQRLRWACSAAQREGAVIVTAKESAGFEFISRSAELFDLSLIQIVSNDRVNHAHWFVRVAQQTSELDAARCLPVFVSPELDQGSAEKPPIRDQLISRLSDQLWVISLRKNGNWHQLIQARLDDPGKRSGSVRLIDGDSSLTELFAEELHANGAVRWCLTDTEGSFTDAPTDLALSNDVATSPHPDTAGILRRLETGEEFLTHWTRRTTGPWPGESQTEFLDGYIFSESPDRTAFGTLKQIARCGRLLASPHGIRSTESVISFTAVSLPDLVKRRHFQTHRNRWDFEHYGLCIARDFLEANLNVRPVIYGDDATWEELTKSDQPFFQQATSQTPSGQIDWTQEMESRHLGDLDLAAIPSTELYLFVATNKEAAALRQETDIPVVSLDELESTAS
jgi:hypothetical protein